MANIEKIFQGYSDKIKMEVNFYVKSYWERDGISRRVANNIRDSLVRLGVKEEDTYPLVGIMLLGGSEGIEPLEIKSGKIIKKVVLPYEGEFYRVRIETREEWERVIKYFVAKWDVDECYGAVHRGVKKFDKPGVFLITKCVEESIHEEDDSNYSGCTMRYNFLEVLSWEEEKERMEKAIANIDSIEGEYMVSIE